MNGTPNNPMPESSNEWIRFMKSKDAADKEAQAKAEEHAANEAANYEAKINGMWYPVNIDGYRSHTFRGHKFDSVCVSVKWHKITNGRRNQELPFYSPSMGGPVYLSSGSVNPRDIRETTDDPLETVYPKVN